MHEDELHRQIAELVADHADHATPPPVAAIRRRGRLRRGRQASGAALLIVAVAAGLVAVQGPQGRQQTPVPVVTQPPPPVVTQPSLPLLAPSGSFVAYVHGRFLGRLADVLVRGLPGGRTGSYEWKLALMRGLNQGERAHQECLVYRTNHPSDRFGYRCLDQSATNKMTFDRGMNGRPFWGLVPKGATRVRLLRPGAPPIEVPTLDIGSSTGFRRGVYLAAWAPDIQTVVALDRQGRQIAHLPVP
jgi:hypothetical protein